MDPFTLAFAYFAFNPTVTITAEDMEFPNAVIIRVELCETAQTVVWSGVIDKPLLVTRGPKALELISRVKTWNNPAAGKFGVGVNAGRTIPIGYCID